MEQENEYDASFQNVSDIKNWISTKLGQLEEKNQLLEEENKKVCQELSKLKEKYVKKKSFTPEVSRRKFYKSRNRYSNRHYRDRNLGTSSSSSENDDDTSSSSNLVSYNRNGKTINNNKNNCGGSPRKFRVSSKSNSLDRRLTKMKKFNFERIKMNQIKISNNNYDYVSVNRNDTVQCNDNGRENNNLSNQKPPTPPLHRLPSWESRIYEIANNGIQSAISTPVQQVKKIDFTNFETNLNTVENNLYSSPIFLDTCVNSSLSIMNNSLDNKKILYGNVGSERNHSLFKSSTTSSGNESDSAGNELKHTTTKLSNSDVLDTNTIQPLEDICNDSLEKLQITSKHFFPSNPQISNALLNDNKLEKSGYLFKLSGKFRVWKKRWFVLKGSTLFYFKRKIDYPDDRTPKGVIVLDQNCSLIRAKECRFHLSYQDGKKNLHLSCDSVESYNDWLRVIGQTLTINNILKLQDNQVPIIENYIIKVRFGHSLKCWTSLYTNHLVYFNNPFEKIPIGYTSLKDCTFQEITSVLDIEDVALIYDDIKKNIHFSISIHPKGNSEPIYLLFLSKQDFSLWHYHLKLALAENNVPKTAFENLLNALLNIESSTNTREEFYAHEIWNNPLLTYTEENLSETLVSLYNQELRTEAFKLFKSLKLFISVPIELQAIDYHVSLIQNCLQVCLDHPELQAEFYYQLIKQSSPKNLDRLSFSPSISKSTFWCSPQSIFKCETKSPSEQALERNLPSEHSIQFLQCVKFLAITVSIFMPQNQVLWFLKHHINRFKDEKTELGQYFLYCERALNRVLLNGPRKRIPSRMEVLSIIQRNPYKHSMPHSIPVHFANCSYEVIGFDGSTTIAEFIRLINSESGIRDNLYSGFALYSDDPIEKNVEHLLDHKAKLADAISYWEYTMRKYNQGKFENTKIIKLTYKHRLCLKKYFKNETDKERLIWIYEINNEILSDRFPVTLDWAIELMSLMMQIEYGNFKNHSESIEQILKKSLPRFLPKKFHDEESIKEIISKRWSELDDRSELDCVRIYLNCTRKWSLCGCKLFQAKVLNSLKYDDLVSLYLFKFFLKHPLIWIGVSEDFIELLEFESFRPLLQITYENLLNYGHFKSYLNLSIDRNCLNRFVSLEFNSDVPFRNSIIDDQQRQQNGHRLLFQLPQTEIIQIITLISDYIEVKKENVG